MKSYLREKLNQKIAKLYLDEHSGPEISKKLNVSIRRVYNALRQQKVPCRDAFEKNHLSFKKKALSFNLKKKFSKYDEKLLISALMLYHGEGAKTGNTVDFINSNVNAHKLFLKFLRKICRVDESKLRFYLYFFTDQDKDELIQFWSSTLKVNKEQFTKPFIRNKSGNTKRVMQNGLLHTRYSDKKLLQKILSLTSDIFKELI